MSFFTGARLDLIREYSEPVHQKGKVLFPIGLNELYISKVELTKSKSGSPMIVLFFKDVQKLYATHKEYFLCDYKLRNACNDKGIPFGIIKLKKFTIDAYNYELQKRTPLLEGIVDQLKELKKTPFFTIVRYNKRLVFNQGTIVEKKRPKSNQEVGLPVVIYDIDLLQFSTDPIDYPQRLHRGLIKQLSEKEQRIFDEHLTFRDEIRNQSID